MNLETATAVSFKYRFKQGDRLLEEFVVALHPTALDLISERTGELPDWSRLDFEQCPNCPFSVETHRHCPLMAVLAPAIARLEHLLSYDAIQLHVISNERTVFQQTTAQRAIGSLLGLMIAASGCPLTAFLKPMARFHLPLANEEETIYWACSMYLLAQFFVRQQGKEPDYDLVVLNKSYQDLHLVNMAIAGRLRTASLTDSSINAIVLLDLFTLAMPHVIEKDLAEIRYLFESYLKL